MINEQVMSFDNKEPDIAPHVFIAPGAFIIGEVTLGEESNVWFNVVLRGDIDYIRIGKRTNIQDNSVIHVTPGTGPVSIGDDVTVGHGAIIHGATIRDRCLIGMGAIILDGAIIEKNSMVAAGSLVAPGKKFPPGVLIMGSPATVARTLSEDEIKFLLISAEHYVDNAKKYLQILKKRTL